MGCPKQIGHPFFIFLKKELLLESLFRCMNSFTFQCVEDTQLQLNITDGLIIQVGKRKFVKIKM